MGSILQEAKCFNTPKSYTADAHFYNPSVNTDSIYFFSSSDMQKFYHLLECHTIGIISSFIYFNFFAFFKFNMQSKKSDKNDSIQIIFIKIIIEINFIKIYIKNTHSITIKYNITRTFIKIEYIFICIQSSKRFLVILIVTNQSGISFNAARESSTALSHIF